MATTYTLTVKRIKLESFEDSTGIRVYFSNTIPGIVKKGDEFVDGDIDNIRFTPAQMIKQLITADPRVEVVIVRNRAKNGSALMLYYSLLKDATINIVRDKYEAGHVFEDGTVAEYGGYSTRIDSIVFADEVEAIVSKIAGTNYLASLL